MSDEPALIWSHPAFACIVRIVGAHAGLTFPENRREITEAAIRRAMAHAGVKDADVFAHRVASDSTMLDVALAELTIGETYFFRDPGQWELVRKEIGPEILQQHPDGRGVRAWSAGCASGEEAYTLAIVLQDVGCVAPLVIGTDVCEHRLARAARGVYTKWSMRGMEATAQRRYFRQSGQHFNLLPEFRNARFGALNLVANEYGQSGQELFGLDVILCRNVLIYIEQNLLAPIFTRMVGALREGGWLMVAASDPQPDSTLPLDVVVTNAGLLYRKRASAPIAARNAALPNIELAPPAPVIARPGVAVRPTPSISDAERAVASYRVSDYARAIMHAEASIASGRGDLSLWILLARAHANRGALDDGAHCVMEAISRYPDVAELHVIDAALQSQRERLAGAAEAARRAVYLDRTLAVAQLALGTALLKLGDIAAADRALRASERMLVDRPLEEIVPASDGTNVRDILAAVRAHRGVIASSGTHVG